VTIRVDRGFSRRYPGADARATECMVNLLRCEDMLSGEMGRYFRRSGLSGATFNVLTVLEGAGEALTPQQIGNRLLVTKGTVTGLLDTLEARGLVHRERHPTDRRMMLVSVTDAGIALLEGIRPEVHRREKALLSCLTPAEKATLVELLGKLQQHLDTEYRSVPNR
jgi:DNA-binding MarR family transcriptional regulator